MITRDRLRTALTSVAALVALASAASTAPAAWAQQEGGAGGAAPGAAAAAPAAGRQETPSTKLLTYKISRDDFLSIQVVRRPEVSAAVQVDLDGTINYHPHVGPLKVVGMTTRQVAEEVRKRLNKFYVRPQVNVTVSQRALKTVSLVGTGIGAARGPQQLRQGYRIFDVLAGAGGLPDDRYEFYEAELIRPGTGEQVKIDLARVFENDPSANLELQPDDILRVNRMDEAKTVVYVSGFVSKTGPVALPRDRSVDTLWQYVAPPSPMALLSKAHIERDGQIIPVDLRPLVTVGALPEKVELMPGDKLVVPENKNYFFMIGAVGKPGINVYPDDRKLTAGRYLVETVLPTQAAEDKKTMLVRTAPDGTMQKFELNVEQMIKSGDFSKDIELQPGDYVYVPYKKGSATQRALNTLTTFGFAVGGIFGIKSVLDLIGL